jgi:hypothetical protein
MGVDDISYSFTSNSTVGYQKKSSSFLPITADESKSPTVLKEKTTSAVAAAPTLKKPSLPTPLKSMIQSLRKVSSPGSYKLSSSGVPKSSEIALSSSPSAIFQPSYRKVIPTPLRKGILLSKRNEEPESLSFMEIISKSAATSSSSPVQSNNFPRVLPTPLRKGILSKRSFGDLDSTEISSSASVKSARKEVVSIVKGQASKKGTSFSLQQAIIARKKTLKHVGGVSDNNESCVKSQLRGLPTPLRKAIALRKENNEISELQLPKSSKKHSKNDDPQTKQLLCGPSKSSLEFEKQCSFLKDIKKSLFSPLKQEIAKRRKSLRANLVPDADTAEVLSLFTEESSLIEQHILSPVVEKVIHCVTESLTATPAKREVVKKGLSTPLRLAIKSRRSTFRKIVGENTPNDDVFVAEDKKDDEETAPQQEEILHDHSNKTAEVKIEPALDFCDEVSAFTLKLVTDILYSNSIQITSDIMSHPRSSTEEEKSAGVDEPVAENVAQILVLDHNCPPSTGGKKRRSSYSLPFLSPITPNNDRHQRNILHSLEKKSKSYYSSLLSTISNREAYLTNLVNHLTDVDMEIIESYTQKLLTVTSPSLMDEQDAFGIAMDAYVRGIEYLLRNGEERALLVSEDKDIDETEVRLVANDIDQSMDCDSCAVDYLTMIEPANQSPTVKEVRDLGDAATEYNENDCIDYSSVLNDLFRLPCAFTDANYDGYDNQFIESYAEELSETAGVSSAVAYGIALDSYVSDPVKFRHYVGRLALPSLQNVYYQMEETVIQSDDSNEELKGERECSVTSQHQLLENDDVITSKPQEAIECMMSLDLVKVHEGKSDCDKVNDFTLENSVLVTDDDGEAGHVLPMDNSSEMEEQFLVKTDRSSLSSEVSADLIEIQINSIPDKQEEILKEEKQEDISSCVIVVREEMSEAFPGIKKRKSSLPQDVTEEEIYSKTAGDAPSKRSRLSNVLSMVCFNEVESRIVIQDVDRVSFKTVVDTPARPTSQRIRSTPSRSDRKKEKSETETVSVNLVSVSLQNPLNVREEEDMYDIEENKNTAPNPESRNRKARGTKNTVEKIREQPTVAEVQVTAEETKSVARPKSKTNKKTELFEIQEAETHVGVEKTQEIDHTTVDVEEKLASCRGRRLANNISKTVARKPVDVQIIKEEVGPSSVTDVRVAGKRTGLIRDGKKAVVQEQVGLDIEKENPENEPLSIVEQSVDRRGTRKANNADKKVEEVPELIEKLGKQKEQSNSPVTSVRKGVRQTKASTKQTMQPEVVQKKGQASTKLSSKEATRNYKESSVVETEEEDEEALAILCDG